MEEYRRLKREHFRLFTLYNKWYKHVHEAKHSNKTVSLVLRTKYTSFRRATDRHAQKNALYSELRTLKRLKMLAWRRYRQRVRFNIFRLVFFKQTKTCPEFCRPLVEQYL